MTPEQKSFIQQVEIRTMRNDLNKINKGGFAKEKPSEANIEIIGQYTIPAAATTPVTQLEGFNNLNPLPASQQPTQKQWPETVIRIDKLEENARRFDNVSNAYEEQRKRLEQQVQAREKILSQKPEEQKKIFQETEDPEKIFLKEIETYREKALAQNLAAHKATKIDQAQQRPITDGQKKAKDTQHVGIVPPNKIITEQVKTDAGAFQSSKAVIDQGKEPSKTEAQKLTVAVHRPSVQYPTPQKPYFKVKPVAKVKAKNHRDEEMAVPEIKFEKAKQPEKPLKEIEPKPEVLGIENLVKGKRFMEEVEEWINSQKGKQGNQTL